MIMGVIELAARRGRTCFQAASIMPRGSTAGTVGTDISRHCTQVVRETRVPRTPSQTERTGTAGS